MLSDKTKYRSQAVSITVVIPVFNQAQRIAACTNSVLKQSYAPLEVLVVDDHSTDDTKEVVRKFVGPKVRLIALETNQGAQTARNRGIIEAKGNWIAFQDADDEWLPNKLEEQVKALTRCDFDPFSVVHSDAIVDNNFKKERFGYRVRWIDGEKEKVYPSLLSAPGPLFPAMLVSKVALIQMNYLDARVGAYQEWDTAVSLARHCRFIHVRKPLLVYNVGRGISNDTGRDIEGYQYVIDKNEDEIKRVCGDSIWRRHLYVQASKYLFHDLHNDYANYARKHSIAPIEEGKIYERAAVLSLAEGQWSKARHFVNMCPPSMAASALRFFGIMHWRPNALIKTKQLIGLFSGKRTRAATLNRARHKLRQCKPLRKDAYNRSLALFTPNADTFANPFLTRFIEESQARNVHILLLCPVAAVDIPSHIHNVTVVPFPAWLKQWLLNPLQSLNLYCRAVWLIIRLGCRVLIGVDPRGLVAAGRMNRYMRAKLGYFSFEIFLLKECAGLARVRRRKNAERSCSKGVQFAVVQDTRRLGLLKGENRFPETCSFFLIPVAPRKTAVTCDKYDVRNEFDLPAHKKLIIHSGTVDRWTGIDKLLELVESGWDSAFWLVIHSRSALPENNTYKVRIKALQSRGGHVSLRDTPFKETRHYYRFLSAFDIGLALYFPNASDYADRNGHDIYVGTNIEEIGLSSGKFSTYMMLGIPTITTRNGIFPDLQRTFDFGATIPEVRNLFPAASTIMQNYDLKRRNAARLYDDVLRAEETFEGLMEYLAAETRPSPC